MMEVLFVRCIPIAAFLILSFFVLGKKQLVEVPLFWSIALCVFMVVSMVALPEDVSIDKPRYVDHFHDGFIWGLNESYRDPGWLWYMIACAKLFNDNVTFFFLLTATIYIFSYLVFALHYFEKNTFYFILMSMGCMGFIAYGINTIRTGFAIAFLMFGVVSKNKYSTILFMICSILIHRSLIIPVVAYYITGLVNKKSIYYVIWIFCFVLAAINVDMGPLFETVGFLDERVVAYGESINEYLDYYQTGFRIDFLLYSVIPFFISLYFVKKYNIEDEALSRISNMYVLVNAVWLLIIRVAYSDRFAYLSWFLIPFITIYPITKYQDRFENPGVLTIGIMFLFMGMNVALWFL